MPQYDTGDSSPLPAVKRYITAHDDQGKAVFAPTSVGSEDVLLKFRKPAAMHVHYTTEGFPIQLKDDKDLGSLGKPGTLAKKNGSVVRMVDLEPGAQSPMHRTQSLDYGVVLEGEVELILEDWDGPVRLMKRGDVSVQRGTMHAWRNASKTEWVRMLYVLLPTEPLSYGGKQLQDDVGEIDLAE